MADVSNFESVSAHLKAGVGTQAKGVVEGAKGMDSLPISKQLDPVAGKKLCRSVWDERSSELQIKS